MTLRGIVKATESQSTFSQSIDLGRIYSAATGSEIREPRVFDHNQNDVGALNLRREPIPTDTQRGGDKISYREKITKDSPYGKRNEPPLLDALDILGPQIIYFAEA